MTRFQKVAARPIRLTSLSIAFTIALTTSPITAQVIPDNTLGSETSIVTPNPNIQGLPADLIQGGAQRGVNLFHSFSEFSIRDGQRVYFANPLNIENIFSRVTGNSTSSIFGTLGVNGGANLFLLNPSGIVFGPNARLDIAGSFLASTADRFDFWNGNEFSATRPQSPPLLTMNLTPGLQYGATPGTIVNAGNLQVGQDLTLTGNTLNLQGQLQAGRNLNLQALDTIWMRDSVLKPLIAQAGGELVLQGNRAIDIFALNHPHSGFFAGGNLLLRSASTVGGDAHFQTGGNFRIEQLNGSLGSLFSPVDPVVRASGDVTFDSYNGASLHILAGGSVSIPGGVTITGVDALGNTIVETVTLSDGSTLNINGATRPTLDVRAGTTAFGAPGITGSTAGFTPVPGVGGTGTSANITIGNINTPGDGLVFLTNQYVPNLALPGGSISTGAILSVRSPVVIDARNGISVTGSINSSTAVGNGGDIRLLNNLGDVRVTGLLTAGAGSGGGIANAGDIFITNRAGNVLLQNIQQGIAPASSSGTAGDVTITAIGGGIAVGSIQARAAGNGAGVGSGNGGRIALNATGNITTGEIRTTVEFPRTAGDGGSIALISTNGTIDTTAGTLFTNSVAGTGGNIVLDAAGDVRTADVLSFVPFGGAGNGGAISIRSRNGAIDTSLGSIDSRTAFNFGTAGAITLTAAGDITTDSIFSISFGTGNSGDISLNSQNGGITVGRINSGSSVNNVDAGDVTLDAAGDIKTNEFIITTSQLGNGGNIRLTSRAGAIDTSADRLDSSAFGGTGGEIVLSAFNNVTTGDLLSLGSTGGAISVTSQTGAIDTRAGELDSSALFGIGGTIVLTAPSNINIGDLFSFGSGGGDINITSGATVAAIGEPTLRRQIDSSTIGSDDAGDIDIQANTIAFADALILSGTGGSGDAGDIALQSDTISLRNTDIVSGSRGSGDAGSISMQASAISLLNGSGVIAGTQNTGQGGNIFITADTLTATGIAPIRLGNPPEDIPNEISTNSTGTGNAGEVVVQVGQLVMRDGAIIASTTGDPDVITSNVITTGVGGNITVNATAIDLSGTSPDGTSPTRIATSSFGTGTAGDLIVNTQTLLLQNGALLSTATFIDGQGGNLTIDAEESIVVQGFADTPSGRILSVLSTDTFGSNQAGDLEIDTPSLTVQDGAAVSVSTFGGGQGGTMLINADQVTLRGTDPSGFASGLYAQAFADGDAGNLTINTDTLTVQDGAIATVEAGNAQTANIPNRTLLNILQFPLPTGDSTGTAGTLTVNSGLVELADRGTLRASTSSGRGGNIALQVDSLINLVRASEISARAFNNGDGGNISINAGVAVLGVLSEDSDVIANADSGNGGNIFARAPLIRGFRQFDRRTGDTPESDFIASSRLGIDGSVEVDTQERLDNPPPINFVDRSNLIAQGCVVGDRASSFTMTGKGGLPADPTEPLTSAPTLVEWVALDPTLETGEPKPGQQSTHYPDRNTASSAIVEAQGWRITQNGEVTLIAQASVYAPIIPLLSPPSSCNPSNSTSSSH